MRSTAKSFSMNVFAFDSGDKFAIPFNTNEYCQAATEISRFETEKNIRKKGLNFF